MAHQPVGELEPVRMPGRKNAQPVGTRMAHHAIVAHRHSRVLCGHSNALKYAGTSGTHTSRLARLRNCAGR